MATKPLNIRTLSQYTEKSCIVSYYREFSTNIEIKNIKLMPVLFARSFGLGANETCKVANIVSIALAKTS